MVLEGALACRAVGSPDARGGAARPESEASGASETSKRGHERLFRFTLFMALVTAVLTVGTPLIGLKSLHSADLLRQFYPWRADAPEARAQNSILTDVVDVITPMHEDAKRRIGDGDFPLNSTYPSGGMPLGAVPSWSVLGPLDAPKMVLPSWYAPAFTKFLELITALTLTYLFLRLLGLGKAAATFGGMLFMNSGFMLISTNWPHAGVTTLVPGVFWGVERTLQRRTLRSAMPLSLVVAASLFQGYPSVTGYALFWAAIYALVRVLAQKGWKPGRPGWLTRARVLTVLGVGVGLGFMLVALQLLPFAGQLDDFYIDYRKQHPRRILALRSLATVAIPDALGSTREKIFYGVRNYAEMQVFLGASAVVVVIAGVARLRRAMFPNGVMVYLWVSTIASVWLIYVGRLPLKILQVAMPTLFGINFVGRMRSVLGFFLAWFAAVCLQAIVDRRSSGKKWLDLSAYAFGVAAVTWGVLRVYRLADENGQADFFLRHAKVPAVAAAGAVVAVVLGSLLRDRARVTAISLVPLFLAIESVTFAGGYVPKIEKDEFYPVTASHQWVLDHIGSERIAAANAVMYPGTTTFYGIRSVSAHGFHHKTWHDMLLTAGSRPRHRSPTLPLLLADNAIAYSAILDRLGAKFWVTSPTVTPPGRLVQGNASGPPVDLAQPVEAAVTHRPKLRNVRVRLLSVDVEPEERAYLHVELLDAAGKVVGDGSRRLFLRSTGAFGVNVSEPSGTVAKVRLSVRGAAEPVSIAGDPGGGPAMSFVAGEDDGLTLVHAHGTAIFERATALPRVRWAGKTFADPDATSRLARLKKGLPRDTVLLSAPGPGGSGQQGTVTIERDTGDDLRVRVDAKGAGYVVVADAMQSGWRAKVDGKDADLVPADHAGVGVHVPAGVHTVTLTYVPSGWHKGVALSFLSALLILGIAIRRPTKEATT